MAGGRVGGEMTLWQRRNDIVVMSNGVMVMTLWVMVTV